jgi:hypothetical protein
MTSMRTAAHSFQVVPDLKKAKSSEPLDLVFF